MLPQANIPDNEHPYYGVEYLPLEQWEDISLTGDMSRMSYTDEPPPSESINILNEGWTFPFYGHSQERIWVDPNGYLSMMVSKTCRGFGFCNWGEKEGSHESTYQRYIAPLMTDFDPSQFPESKVTFKFGIGPSPHNESRLIVQWSNVVLFSYEKNLHWDSDGFTFQAIIGQSGEIIFNYFKIPYYPGNKFLVEPNISKPAKRYPSLMGLEDAVPSREEGEEEEMNDYAPLDLDFQQIMALYKLHGSVTVKFTPFPSCFQFQTSEACANYTLTSGLLQCEWCIESSACADKYSRDSISLHPSCLPPLKLKLTSQSAIVKITGGGVGFIVIACCVLICFKKGRKYKYVSPKPDASVPNTILV